MYTCAILCVLSVLSWIYNNNYYNYYAVAHGKWTGNCDTAATLYPCVSDFILLAAVPLWITGIADWLCMYVCMYACIYACTCSRQERSAQVLIEAGARVINDHEDLLPSAIACGCFHLLQVLVKHPQIDLNLQVYAHIVLVWCRSEPGHPMPTVWTFDLVNFYHKGFKWGHSTASGDQDYGCFACLSPTGRQIRSNTCGFHAGKFHLLGSTNWKCFVSKNRIVARGKMHPVCSLNRSRALDSHWLFLACLCATAWWSC